MASTGLEHAVQLDEADPLSRLRAEFLIPTKADVARKTLVADSLESGSSEPCTYLAGNSLGLQPRRVGERIGQFLETWRTQGVQGHFKPLSDSPLPTWLHVDARAAQMVASIVGAAADEVAVMQTLTANLHLLMAAFYRPDIKGRHKVIIESKAFPSDHYLVETQVRHHGLNPAESTVFLEPGTNDHVLTMDYIESVLREHAETTAVLLLPGIQYYSGQLLDIPAVTALARSLGVFVIWDLAHAVGNVPLQLHEWDVDAAAWCSYKYLNGGPGCIGGAYVHSRHGRVDDDAPQGSWPNRLAGWWGNDKSGRFAMQPGFRPASGASGFQLSNPSVADITSLCASLEVFELAGGVAPLRGRSLRLTAYLVDEVRGRAGDWEKQGHWSIITPAEPEGRGAQVSILLADGLLEPIMEELEVDGVVIDERRPNVIRVAPAPLYNTFRDCFDFATSFARALGLAVPLGGK